MFFHKIMKGNWQNWLKLRLSRKNDWLEQMAIKGKKDSENVKAVSGIISFESFMSSRIMSKYVSGEMTSKTLKELKWLDETLDTSVELDRCHCPGSTCAQDFSLLLIICRTKTTSSYQGSGHSRGFFVSFKRRTFSIFQNVTKIRDYSLGLKVCLHFS